MEHITKRIAELAPLFSVVEASGTKCRWLLTYSATNRIGEVLHVELLYCKMGDDLAESMQRQGLTPPQYWWSAQACVEDAQLNYTLRYNPLISNHGLNYEWLKEATASNLQKLLNEIIRRFMEAK